MRSLNHRENRRPLTRGRLAADERLRDQEIPRPTVLTPPRRPLVLALQKQSPRDSSTCSPFYSQILEMDYWGYYSVYCRRC